MPSFAHHGASIYYEEFGQGFPILTFAPAGPVDHRRLAPSLCSREPHHRVQRGLPGDRAGSA